MLAASTLSSPTPTPTPTPDSGTAGRLLAAAVHVRRRLDTIARAGHRVDDTAADLAAYLRLVDGALLALARSPSDDSTLLALAARHSAVTAVLRAGAARQPSLTLQLIAYCMEHVERGLLLAQRTADSDSGSVETSSLQHPACWLDLQTALFLAAAEQHGEPRSTALQQARNVCRRALKQVDADPACIVWSLRLRLHLVHAACIESGVAETEDAAATAVASVASTCDDAVRFVRASVCADEDKVEFALLVLLTKAQVALVRYDYKMAALALAAAQPLVTKVADALAIDNDGASQPTVGASQPTTDASVAIPTKNMHLLYLHFLALSILFHFHTGNTTVASAYLAKCHAALEQADDSGSDTMDCSPNATPEDGSAAQPLSSAFPLLSGGQLNLLDGAITMQWLTKYEFFSVVYLLSGLCMTSEANLVPSKKYLLEGFKFLEDEYDKPATTINTHLFITLKAHLFRQLLFTLLQKNEWSECEKLLPLYMDHCWSSGGATSALWRAHEWDIAVARAHIHQAMGELGLALKEFEGVAKNCPHAELQLYAQLHAMLLSIQQGDMERVAVVLPAVETACAGSKLIGMRAAMYLVEALKSLQEQEYHKTKIKILECLKLCSSTTNNLAAASGSPSKTNASSAPSSAPDTLIGRFVCTQLKAIALAVISEVYDTTANEHGEKMLAAAYPLLKKMKADTVALIVGRLLKDWLERNNADATKTDAIHAQALANEHHERMSQRIIETAGK